MTKFGSTKINYQGDISLCESVVCNVAKNADEESICRLAFSKSESKLKASEIPMQCTLSDST